MIGPEVNTSFADNTGPTTFTRNSSFSFPSNPSGEFGGDVKLTTKFSRTKGLLALYRNCSTVIVLVDNEKVGTFPQCIR